MLGEASLVRRAACLVKTRNIHRLLRGGMLAQLGNLLQNLR
jgi:hypothetical protein